METAQLKKFARSARRSLMEQVAAKLALVLPEGSTARRERAEAVRALEQALMDHSKDQVIERVAYTWFNRFCALRFMDVNRYTRTGVVSPTEGQSQPELLAEAKMGHIDENMAPAKTRQQVFALLDGSAPSSDPQGEAYRLLLVAACNSWNKAMPFLFQPIDDYTELLMPDDLLSGHSTLAHVREAMTPDVCEDVEVIGWLYQFYISEKKDEVFEGLKKNRKITPENIPAATQLFTPHWIVRYLVENSLGRLWMLNRPNSKLTEQMEYYIRPEQAESDFLRIDKPEEIRICDPACGSGHMLTYAFDLLYAIYEEEGHEPAEIPEKILTHNLYGIEIDPRAGALAAFALSMKARARQRRFFSRGIEPNICVLEKICFDEVELEDYLDFIGRDLFTASLQTALRQFEEADNFGSLIRPDVSDVEEILRTLEARNVSGQLFLGAIHKMVLQALQQVDYLSPRYHVVIANPPYMGGKGMNGKLNIWAKESYPHSNSDLFSMFVERILLMLQEKGYTGLMTPFTWMYLTSFEKFRSLLLRECTITGVVRPEYHSFFESAYVPICAFTLLKQQFPSMLGVYIDLQDFYGAENQPIKFLEANNNPDCGWYYTACSNDHLKIPGSPIAYWISETERDLFEECQPLGKVADAKQGLITGDNERFLRFWNEVALGDIGLGIKSRKAAQESKKKWFPHHKGGNFKKWYGNNEYVVDWEDDGKRIKNFVDKNGKLRSRPQNLDYYFKPAVTWTSLTVASFNGRLCEGGFIYDAKGPLISPFDRQYLFCLVGLLNCRITNELLKLLAPTMDYNQGPVSKLPWPKNIGYYLDKINHTVKTLEAIAKSDWNSYETSWDFTSFPLLHFEYRQPVLKSTYQKLRLHSQEITLEMQRLEEENNRIFIDAYGLQDELTSDVPLKEITLTCNPHYRYGSDKTEEELERLLLADTMRELVSYAVGCMFGRYALEKPGLILANQGETFDNYLEQVPEPSFPADDDNVIPLLDGEWFSDDIVGRFRKFLQVAFGEEHYEENLRFVEQALNVKGRRDYNIRTYFLGEFYNDHVKRYKKRPIYWLFSSPKGSFNALIYLHRYRPDTASVVLNDYLREFRAKLSAHKDHLETLSISADASQGEKTKAIKDIEKTNKMIAELEQYENETLYPLATRQVQIDLDDGVKVNYPRLGPALKKIPGLSN